LNEDIKAAFERVAKEYDARADAAKQQRDQELNERQQFEVGYQNKKDEVILPALRFVTTILEPHCGDRSRRSCSLVPFDSPKNIELVTV
jgi:hypothetical protein